jgi:hypothetical protein
MHPYGQRVDLKAAFIHLEAGEIVSQTAPESAGASKSGGTPKGSRWQVPVIPLFLCVLLEPHQNQILLAISGCSQKYLL